MSLFSKAAKSCAVGSLGGIDAGQYLAKRFHQRPQVDPVPSRPQRCGERQPRYFPQHHARRCVVAQAFLDHRDPQTRSDQPQRGKRLGGLHPHIRGEACADTGADELIVSALAWLHADPFLIGQIRRGQRCQLVQRVMFGQRQQHRVVQHLEAQQVRVVDRRRLTDQRDIEATLTQAFQLFGRTQVVQRDMHVRPVDPQYAQGIGQNPGVHRVLDVADAQAAFFATAQAFAEGFQAIGVGQQGAGFGEKGLAVAGQAYALLAAFEQGQAQAFFELGDLSAQGRLGNVQALGGAADVFFLGDDDEVAQLADVDHVRPSGTQVLLIMSWTV
ncbi:putative DUF5753 domain-containing protein [Pseudomonas sp. IT-P2]